MAADDRHEEIANLVCEILRDNVEDGFSAGDIRVEDYPFTQQPGFGICVSAVDEFEGSGTNERDDIGYVIQVTRVLHGLGNTGITSRSKWRTRTRRLFHRKRIGVDGCELVCKVTVGKINIPKEWVNWNIDASAMRISCMVRENRE